PVGTGFSFGNANIFTTHKATEYLYEFLQNFYKIFPQYHTNAFGIWASDYGSAFATSLAVQILLENAGVGYSKSPSQVYMNLTSLGLESPNIDPELQLKTVPIYLGNNKWLEVHKPDKAKKLWNDFEKIFGHNLENCAEGKKQKCGQVMIRYRKYLQSITSPENLRTKFDLWDIRNARYESDQARNARMKATPAAKWLNKPRTQTHLGVTGGKLNRPHANFEPWNTAVAAGFWQQQEIQSKVRTLIVGGDADVIANYFGLRSVAEDVVYVDSGDFQRTGFNPLVWNASAFGLDYKNDPMKEAGEYKQFGDLAFVKVKEAGHVIGESKPEVLVNLFWRHVKGLHLDVALLPKKKGKEDDVE
ncbi:hypothetical protein FZEAL_10919, partial [Fusarium zealandicum]